MYIEILHNELFYFTFEDSKSTVGEIWSAQNCIQRDGGGWYLYKFHKLRIPAQFLLFRKCGHLSSGSR